MVLREHRALIEEKDSLQRETDALMHEKAALEASLGNAQLEKQAALRLHLV